MKELVWIAKCAPYFVVALCHLINKQICMLICDVHEACIVLWHCSTFFLILIIPLIVLIFSVYERLQKALCGLSWGSISWSDLIGSLEVYSILQTRRPWSISFSRYLVRLVTYDHERYVVGSAQVSNWIKSGEAASMWVSSFKIQTEGAWKLKLKPPTTFSK